MISNDYRAESTRIVPRTLVVAFILPIVLTAIGYGTYRAYGYYNWVYKPRVIAQGIVLEEFDEWMSVVPEEHHSTYEAIRTFAKQSNHTPPVYYIIGIRMLAQVSDGTISPEEVRTADAMRAALVEYDGDLQRITQYIFRMMDEPGLDAAKDDFWSRGVLPLKFNEL